MNAHSMIIKHSSDKNENEQSLPKSYWCLVGSFGFGSTRNCPVNPIFFAYAERQVILQSNVISSAQQLATAHSFQCFWDAAPGTKSPVFNDSTAWKTYRRNSWRSWPCATFPRVDLCSAVIGILPVRPRTLQHTTSTLRQRKGRAPLPLPSRDSGGSALWGGELCGWRWRWKFVALGLTNMSVLWRSAAGRRTVSRNGLNIEATSDPRFSPQMSVANYALTQFVTT